MSYLQGISVSNPNATKLDLCSDTYAVIDTVVDMVSNFGPVILVAKCNLKSAFRLLPVHPQDCNLSGFGFGIAF